MDKDRILRDNLLELIRGGSAIAFDDAVADLPLDRINDRPGESPHSAWELLEHLRIALSDIVEFSISPDHASPEWPKGYWPDGIGTADKWNASVDAIRSDIDRFCRLVDNEDSDLYSPFEWGTGQTLLREAMLAADHNAYHLGQLVLVKKML